MYQCDELLLALSEIEHVESISIWAGVQMNPATIVQLGTARWWTQVRKLQLCEIYQEEPFSQQPEFDQALSALKNSDKLTTFALTFNRYVTTDKLMSIAMSCKNLTYFKELTDDGYSFNDLSELIKFGSYQCERLILSCGYGYDDILITKEWYDCLAQCQNLKNLDIGSGFTKLGFLANFPKLEKLKIRTCQELDWISLCGSIKHGSLPSVQKLTICQLDFPLDGDDAHDIFLPPNDDPDSAAFTEAFSEIFAPACPNLKWLKVQSFSSCSQLIPFFKSCPDIQVIKLENKHHSQDPDLMVDLVCAPQCKLEYLELHYLRISDEQAQRMLRHCVSLKGINSCGILYIKKSMSLDQLATLLQNVEPIYFQEIKRVSLVA